MESVLVTGATGFIGQHLVHRLLQQRASVRVFLRGNSFPSEWENHVDVAEGDILDLSSLQKATDGIATVFHLAGKVHDLDELSDTGEHEEVTLNGTENLIAAVGESGVKRVVFLSSLSVYGTNSQTIRDETVPCHPISAYGRAKLQAEQCLFKEGAKFGVHVCCLRPAMVYGPGCKGNLLRMIKMIDRLLLITALCVPMLIIALLIKLTSRGPVLYWSDRVGVNNTIFKMPKFRTMRVNTPAVATHLLENPDRYVTSIGRFLRKTSLDELPQLFSILKGDISFVGPRPALYNQEDLIALRTERGIHRLVPGLTGWAQINGRDDLPIPRKVEFDEYYINHQSFSLDLKILFMTFFKVMRGEGVKH